MNTYWSVNHIGLYEASFKQTYPASADQVALWAMGSKVSVDDSVRVVIVGGGFGGGRSCQPAAVLGDPLCACGHERCFSSQRCCPPCFCGKW
ncbi:hypothetical protein lerEdw1_013840 [Lerista edwardsae]|nr:hypothetical protein lerEdw1_013840 [Lerista edwardsae]